MAACISSLVAFITLTGFAASAEKPFERQQILDLQRVLYSQPGMLGVSPKRVSGVVVLSGEVADEAVREKAQATAEAVLATHPVQNRLRIQPPEVFGPRAVRDSVLTAKIESALERNPELKGFRRHLDLSVTERAAVIKGKLDGAAQAQALVERIREIPGLVSLDFHQLAY